MNWRVLKYDCTFQRFGLVLVLLCLPVYTSTVGNSSNLNLHCPTFAELSTYVVQQTLANYSDSIPPEDGIIPVRIGVFPLRLLDVDEARSVVNVEILFHLRWNDSRLAWARHWPATSDDGCANHRPPKPTSIPFPVADIWVPSFSLAEMVQTWDNSLDAYWTKAFNIPDTGEAFIAIRYIGELMCPMQLRAFPFDEQTCNATVLGPGINYTNLSVENAVAYYEDDVFERKIFGPQMSANMWMLNPTDCHLRSSLGVPVVTKAGVTTALTYRFYLHRRWGSYIFSWLVPPIVLSVTCVVGMFLACTSGERFSFGAAIVVTLAVLNDSLNSKLSVGSDGYPLLAWLHTGLFLIVVCATCVSTVPRMLTKRRMLLLNRNKVRPKNLARSTEVPSIASSGGSERQENEEEHRKLTKMRVLFAYNVTFAAVFIALQVVLLIVLVIEWMATGGCRQECL